MHCPTCGSETFASARFCRQCGAALFADGDILERAGRQYARPDANPAVATVDSAPLPPSIADAIAADTMRYPQPPQAAQSAYASPAHSAGSPPAVPTASLGRKRRLLKWGVPVLTLVIGCGIGAAINEESQRGRVYLSQAERTRLEQMRREDALNRARLDLVADQRERAKEDIERQMEEVQRAREEAERAAERGGPVVAGEQPLNLSGFEYPGATSGQYSRIPGREMMTQMTGDNFETITQYYQLKLGPPLAQISGKQALFQSAGPTPVAVLVRNGRGRQWEIVLMRSPLRFLTPQAGQLQAEGGNLPPQSGTTSDKAPQPGQGQPKPNAQDAAESGQKNPK